MAEITSNTSTITGAMTSERVNQLSSPDSAEVVSCDPLQPGRQAGQLVGGQVAAQVGPEPGHSLSPAVSSGGQRRQQRTDPQACRSDGTYIRRYKSPTHYTSTLASLTQS